MIVYFQLFLETNYHLNLSKCEFNNLFIIFYYFLFLISLFFKIIIYLKL
jgi:hypothetical protein